ncbi:hypothetical protein GCM10025734_79940 [Kitasatospora paranensis]
MTLLSLPESIMHLPKSFRQISLTLMKPLTEQEIRTAFVNCTKGEAKRLAVPRDLADVPWADLDYLGWRDPQAPGRAYLVAELDGLARAVALRSPPLPAGTCGAACARSA